MDLHEHWQFAGNRNEISNVRALLLLIQREATQVEEASAGTVSPPRCSNRRKKLGQLASEPVEGQAQGYRRELIAGANLRIAEALRKDAADSRDERGAAGQKNGVDVPRVRSAGL